MASAHLRDEHGNPVELTDELGRPVKLTDEQGRPIHLTGVAFSSSDTTAPIAPSTHPTTGMESATLGPGMQGPRAEPHVHHETLGEVLEGGQYQPRRDQTDKTGFGGVAGEIQHSAGSSPSSTSSEGDDGLGEGPERAGRRRKKKGLGEKIKEKFMGGKHEDKDKDAYQTATTTVTATTTTTIEHHEDDHQKKGFMEKVKDKIPGMSHH